MGFVYIDLLRINPTYLIQYRKMILTYISINPTNEWTVGDRENTCWLEYIFINIIHFYQIHWVFFKSQKEHAGSEVFLNTQRRMFSLYMKKNPSNYLGTWPKYCPWYSNNSTHNYQVYLIAILSFI